VGGALENDLLAVAWHCRGLARDDDHFTPVAEFDFKAYFIEARILRRLHETRRVSLFESAGATRHHADFPMSALSNSRSARIAILSIFGRLAFRGWAAISLTANAAMREIYEEEIAP
jgi:hypothetical protein